MAANQMPRRTAPPASGRSVHQAPVRSLAQTERDVVRLRPFGAVDRDTLDQLREHIENCAARGTRHLVLDLRGVTLLGSTGLELVLEADAAARADGWKFTLIGAPAHVQRVFDLTGTRPRLPFLTASQLAALLAATGDATT